MKRVLTAAALVPVVLLIVFRAPLWLFALVVAVIVLLAMHELLGLIRAYGVEPISRTAYVMSTIVVFGTFSGVEENIWLREPLLQLPWLFRAWDILLILPLVFGIAIVFRRDLRGALMATAGTVFGVLYIAVTLALLIPLRSSSVWNVLILFILFSVWAGDIAAYYVGRAIGRHKLAPIVSPNKTWEGAIASVIASVAASWVTFHFQASLRGLFAPQHSEFYTAVTPADVPLLHVIAIGILTNVAAQFGDLFESALKRGAGVKDSGTLLPGHGGVLDRIDALLFAVPVVWYYANLTGQFQQAINLRFFTR
jgi:phosphatidate cytidylyltransferase